MLPMLLLLSFFRNNITSQRYRELSSLKPERKKIDKVFEKIITFFKRKYSFKMISLIVL